MVHKAANDGGGPIFFMGIAVKGLRGFAAGTVRKRAGDLRPGAVALAQWPAHVGAVARGQRQHVNVLVRLPQGLAPFVADLGQEVAARGQVPAGAEAVAHAVGPAAGHAQRDAKVVGGDGAVALDADDAARVARPALVVL